MNTADINNAAMEAARKIGFKTEGESPGLREAVAALAAKWIEDGLIVPACGIWPKTQRQCELADAILAAVAPFVGDRKDGERLDWMEKNAHGAFGWGDRIGTRGNLAPLTRWGIDAARNATCTAQPAAKEAKL